VKQVKNSILPPACTHVIDAKSAARFGRVVGSTPMT